MTQREMFVAISNFLEASSPNMDATPAGMNPEDFLEDAIQFCNDRIDALDKRKNAPRKMTSAQRENVEFKQEIVRFLNSCDKARASEIANAVGISVQRCTALLKQLVTDGYVLRETDKKVTTFRTRD